jgi:hypothetical protein
MKSGSFVALRACTSAGAFAVIVLLSGILVVPAGAQEDEHDVNHHHGYLHFSHPIVTESPSPDTKFRLDFIHSWSDDAGETGNTIRAEGEYAFSPAVSLAVVVPYRWASDEPPMQSSGFENVELSLKAASLKWGERGVLVGGGISLGLPTGPENVSELSPFADVGVRRGNLELVGFLTYSTTLTGEETIRSLEFDGSALFRASDRFELLGEISTDKSLETGAPGARTFLAPGIKLRPLLDRDFVLGVSFPIGVGTASGTNSVFASLFYHF